MKDKAALLWDWLSGLSNAYRQTFGNVTHEGAQMYVLEDLAKFCHAHTPTNGEREAGRRDVWLRIQEQLRLSPEQLYMLYDQRLAKKVNSNG